MGGFAVPPLPLPLLWNQTLTAFPAIRSAESAGCGDHYANQPLTPFKLKRIRSGAWIDPVGVVEHLVAEHACSAAQFGQD
jgi:hypothetical protein